MSKSESKRSRLFEAPRSNGYQRDDFRIVCKETPIPKDELPDYLAKRVNKGQWMPPLLWLGWRMGANDAIVLDLPNVQTRTILYTDGSPDYDPYYDFRDDLVTALQLSEAEQELFELHGILDVDQDGETSLILAVGNNNPGDMLSSELIQRIKEAGKIKEEPKWWLDEIAWYWVPGPKNPRRADFLKEIEAGKLWRW
ncbi:hypothetical protein CYLTODRAFT_493188 [Cylindrobasidium torrendii FP15055 ss-10]|uniref:Uncharacterized protein n=1 Tax=Cylindrobasidium torrendii FP15055 ss-10 TaxID=1314674 RepID=A0A0D7B154_9AGAR|nr:hypothetical protein CYLTODRAFT_493188 [Cylindrobasidium torrendii FP15055 ss-10]